MKKKIKVIIYIMAVVSFVFAVLWAVALKDIVPMTKQKFNGYSDFREKVECPFFADSLPESAEKAKYYQHSGWFKKTCGYSAILSYEDYCEWKKNSEERYHLYNTNAVTEFYQYSSYDKKSLYSFFPEEDELGFLNDFCSNDKSNYYIFSEIREYNSAYDYHYGIICNDNKNEIIEFYYKNSNTL